MKIDHVRVSPDNYAYIIMDEATNTAVTVDIFDVPKVMSRVPKGVQVVAALTTHHHQDHSGGNKAFLKAYPDTHIWGGWEPERDGSESEPSNTSTSIEYPAQSSPSFIDSTPYTKLVKDGSEFKLGNIQFKCLWTPCHTQDHICYHAVDTSKPSQAGAVFSGDTLFVGGCGRFFEGVGKEMHASLSKLAHLPDDTVVYAGHEYTASNLKFAKAVDKDGAGVKRLEKLVEEAERTKNDKPADEGKACTTGKSTIADEKEWNVFMRLDTAPVREKTKSGKDVSADDVMDELRSLKDNFRG